MRAVKQIVPALLLLASAVAADQGATAAKSANMAAPGHGQMSAMPAKAQAGGAMAMSDAMPMVADPAALAWGPSPPGLPPGAKLAVIAGDPGKAGPFTIRAWMPDGYAVPPHWHSVDENLTILSGSLQVGTGDTLDWTQATTLRTGGYVGLAPRMHHFARAVGDTVIQIHAATGPFDIHYLNPADDPRTAKPTGR